MASSSSSSCSCSREGEALNMNPWTGPDKLPKHIQNSLRKCIWFAAIISSTAILRLLFSSTTLTQYNATAFHDLSIFNTDMKGNSAAFNALTTHSKVVMVLYDIQLTIECLLFLPTLLVAFSIQRVRVQGVSFFIRLFTATSIMVALLRLSSFSSEINSIVHACVQTQTRTNDVTALAVTDAAAATALCAKSLAWVKPVNIIDLLINIGLMLTLCRNVVKYERELLAERYPSQAGGYLSWIFNRIRRNGRTDEYARLPAAAEEETNEKQD